MFKIALPGSLRRQLAELNLQIFGQVNIRVARPPEPIFILEPIESRIFLSGTLYQYDAVIAVTVVGSLGGDSVNETGTGSMIANDADSASFITTIGLEVDIQSEGSSGYSVNALQMADIGFPGFSMANRLGGDHLPIDGGPNPYPDQPYDLSIHITEPMDVVSHGGKPNPSGQGNSGQNPCKCDGDKNSTPKSSHNPDCKCGGGPSGNSPTTQSPNPASTTGQPVYYANGVVDQADEDLSSDAFAAPWGVTRDWTNNPQSLGTYGDQIEENQPKIYPIDQPDVYGNNVVENELPRLVEQVTTTVTYTLAGSGGSGGGGGGGGFAAGPSAGSDEKYGEQSSPSGSGTSGGTTLDDSHSYSIVVGQNVNYAFLSDPVSTLLPTGLPKSSSVNGDIDVKITPSAYGVATNGNNITWFNQDSDGVFEPNAPGDTLSGSAGTSPAPSTRSYVDSTGAQGHFVEYDEELPEVTISNSDGSSETFYGFDSSIPLAKRGLFKSETTADGVQIAANYNAGGNLSSVVRSFESALGATQTEEYDYTYGSPYVYVSGGQSYSLLRVTGIQELRFNSNAPSAKDYVQDVQYKYYGYNSTDSFGNLGDLEYARTYDGQGPTDGSVGNPINTDYYRYYTADGNGGYTGGLKTIVTGSAYARLTKALGATDPAQATDAQVIPFADYQYTYDASYRIASETVAGAGNSASSAGLGTITYSYAATTTDGNTNVAAMVTTVTMPDGNETIVSTNSHQQILSETYEEVSSPGNPSPADPMTITLYHYNEAGLLIQIDEPSSMQRDSSGSWHTSADTGLVETIVYAQTTTAMGGYDTVAPIIGDVAGYQKEIDYSQGTEGTPEPQESWEYLVDGQNGNHGIVEIASDTTYGGTGGSDPRTTSYAYQFGYEHHVEEMDVTLPTIALGQNGDGTSETYSFAYDLLGRLEWSRDPSGSLTYRAYDLATAVMTERIQDVDLDPGAADDGKYDTTYLPSSWSALGITTGGLGLVTAYTDDDQGRYTKQVDPDGNITVWTYNDPEHEVREYDGWTGTSATGPTIVNRQDWANDYTESLTMSAAPNVTNGLPDGSEPISNVQSLSRSLVNAAGQVVETDAYFNLSDLNYAATLQLGAIGSNYYATKYGYDINGNQGQTTDPNGTIEQDVYNGQGDVVSVWVGTSEAANWSPTNTSGSDLVDVQDNYYDYWTIPLVGTVVDGDGNLSKVVTHPGAGQPDRVTTYAYDFKDEPILEIDGLDSAQPIVTATAYDNAGEAIETQQYAGAGLVLNDNVPAASSLLRAQTVYYYDDQGRIYQHSVYSVDPTSGSVNAPQSADSYYDVRGELLASSDPTGIWTKYVYDGAGRLSTEFSTDGAGGVSDAEASSVTNDHVLSQQTFVYDGDDNLIETIECDRLSSDSAATSGALGNTSGIGGPASRITYTASYYDASNRDIADVDAGANNGSSWTRPASAPTSSASLLVTTYTYDAAGNLSTVIDPLGIVTANSYDALNRQTKVISDHSNGTPTDNSNQTTTYAYDGDNDLVSETAVMPAGETSQTTNYFYGVSPANGSSITDNDLLYKTEYPDPATGAPSASQAETYTYDSAGNQTSYTDRNGTTHVYNYDALNRLTSDTVTAFGAGVDTSVGRLAYGYNDAGLQSLLTSYSPIGTIINQTENIYNGFGQILDQFQANAGAVDPLSADITVNNGASQRSMVTSVTVRFNEAVTLSSGAISLLFESTTGGTATSISFTLTASSDDKTYTLTFPSGTNGSLANGSYELTLAEGSVTDSNGNTNSTAQNYSLFRLYGDINGDGKVDTADYNAFMASYGARSTQPAYVAAFDAYGTNRITAADYSFFLSDDGTTLSVPQNSVTTQDISYSYSSASSGSRLASMTYPDGRTLAFNYASGIDDRIGRLTSISDGAGLIQSYSYQGLDTPLGLIDGNGVNETVALDSLGRPAEITFSSALSTIDSFSYLYDADGNVLSRQNNVISNQSELYSYDDLSRLSAFSRGTLSSGETSISSSTASQSWSLDALGNWDSSTDGTTTTTRTNDAQNHATQVGSATLNYDADGNTLIDQNGQDYVYDAWNRLAAAKNNSGTTIALYTYDPSGRRLTETEGGVTRALYYSSAGQVLEEQQNGSTTTQNVWAPFYVNQLIERDDQPNSSGTLTRRLYAEQDSNYNVTSLTDASGNVVQRFVYSPYGVATVESASGASTSDNYDWAYTFQGGRQDAATGLIHFGAREYSPTLGRWMQEDPAGYIDGPNRYQLELSSPTNKLDPTGTESEGSGSENTEDPLETAQKKAEQADLAAEMAAKQLMSMGKGGSPEMCDALEHAAEKAEKAALAANAAALALAALKAGQQLSDGQDHEAGKTIGSTVSGLMAEEVIGAALAEAGAAGPVTAVIGGAVIAQMFGYYANQFQIVNPPTGAPIGAQSPDDCESTQHSSWDDPSGN